MNIREKLYDVDAIIEEIKNFPQTYDTRLKDCYDDGTCQFILRRKLNNLCKQGVVCKVVIPGTRYGKVIFFMLTKKHHILIENVRIGVNVYCFLKYERENKWVIKIDDYWELSKNAWVQKNNERRIFDGDVLKWI
jgi:hypothetical protein